MTPLREAERLSAGIAAKQSKGDEETCDTQQDDAHRSDRARSPALTESPAEQTSNAVGCLARESSEHNPEDANHQSEDEELERHMPTIACHYLSCFDTAFGLLNQP